MYAPMRNGISDRFGMKNEKVECNKKKERRLHLSVFRVLNKVCATVMRTSLLHNKQRPTAKSDLDRDSHMINKLAEDFSCRYIDAISRAAVLVYIRQ